VNRIVLLLVALASTAAIAADRKPVLTIYGDANIRNCRAFDQAWKTQPDFRAALQAKYDIRFPQTAGPIGYRCYPTFVVEGTEPLCGFRGPDVLLWELGLQPPATPRPNATVATGELNEIKAAINSAVAQNEHTRGELAQVKERTNSTAAELDALRIESTAFRDRTETGWQRVDELRQTLDRETRSNATLDRRIEAIELRPSPPPNATGPSPAEPPAKASVDAKPGRGEKLFKLFGYALTFGQAIGVVATGSTGVGALAVLLPLAIRGISRRRAAKSSATPRTPVPGTEPGPPATRVIPETRYTPIVTDRFAESYAWTRSEFGKRYPGSIDVLETFDGMLRQHEASKPQR